MMDIPAGHWRGTVETWLDPAAPPATNHVAATSMHLLDGKTVQVEYRSHVGESRSDGLMIIGADIATNQPCLTWIDTFHTGANVGIFAADAAGAFLGSYAAGDEKWGWRIVIRMGEELRIEHVNITPAGEEFRAIEMTLHPA